MTNQNLSPRKSITDPLLVERIASLSNLYPDLDFKGLDSDSIRRIEAALAKIMIVEVYAQCKPSDTSTLSNFELSKKVMPALSTANALWERVEKGVEPSPAEWVEAHEAAKKATESLSKDNVPSAKSAMFVIVHLTDNKNFFHSIDAIVTAESIRIGAYSVNTAEEFSLQDARDPFLSLQDARDSFVSVQAMRARLIAALADVVEIEQKANSLAALVTGETSILDARAARLEAQNAQKAPSAPRVQQPK